MRSKVARSQPAKMAILPVSARWQPPETGQSTAAPPRSVTSAPRRLTSAASVVDISIQILPAVTSGSICCITASLAAGLGRQVMTASQSRISWAGLSPRVAPRATNPSTKSPFRSCTETSWPLRSRLPASLDPTFPSPMKPIFMVCPLPVRAPRRVPLAELFPNRRTEENEKSDTRNDMGKRALQNRRRAPTISQTIVKALATRPRICPKPVNGMLRIRQVAAGQVLVPGSAVVRPRRKTAGRWPVPLAHLRA